MTVTAPGKASTNTVRAARNLAHLAAEDFASPPGGDVMAAWSARGLLIVAVKGWKAASLDAFMRDEGIAAPHGRAREQASAA